MISIIIPNYNHHLFLQPRIESILYQTHNDFEIIILDDCSTDSSREIIEEYRSHPKVSHVVYNESNSSCTFKQWKKGIELAKGELIWIAESDDYAVSNFLEKLVKPFNDPDAILAFSNSLKVDQSGNILGKYYENNFIAENKNVKETTITAKEFCKRFLLHANYIPNASAVVFRKNALPESVFERLQNFKLAGDWAFWFQLLNQHLGNIYYTDECLNHYRFQPESVRFRKNRPGKHLVEMLQVQAMIQAQVNLSDKEKSALKYNMLHKFIRFWKVSGFRFSIKDIRLCLSAIKRVSPGIMLPFIRTFIVSFKKQG